MSCSHILWSKYEKQNHSYPSILFLHFTFTKIYVIEIAEFTANHSRSEMQAPSEPTRGVVKTPSVEAPPSVGCLPSVQTTCWKPRGGAQPDSLGSARLPGAAAPVLSQGLSCSGSTTRNCNPSQSQHPEQSHLQSTPHLLRLNTGGPIAAEGNALQCAVNWILPFFIFRGFV